MLCVCSFAVQTQQGTTTQQQQQAVYHIPAPTQQIISSKHIGFVKFSNENT